jgi:hypothetical protein
VVTPSAGGIVLVPFPFSDLSQAKLRPAVDLMVAQVATLSPEAREQLITAVVGILRGAGVS